MNSKCYYIKQTHNIEDCISILIPCLWFGLWKEAGVTRENMQTTHRTSFEPETFSRCGANHCTTVSPYSEIYLKLA